MIPSQLGREPRPLVFGVCEEAQCADVLAVLMGMYSLMFLYAVPIRKDAHLLMWQMGIECLL